jgi:Ca2+-transporting ATPase
MKNRPRDPRESVFSREVKAYLVLSPIITTALLLGGYFYYQPWLGNSNLDEARTQLFTSVVLIELAIAISCRSLKYPVFKVGIFKNKFLWLAVLSSLSSQLVVLYTPQLQSVFDVTYPQAINWIIAMASMGVAFASLEVGKHFMSRKQDKPSASAHPR